MAISSRRSWVRFSLGSSTVDFTCSPVFSLPIWPRTENYDEQTLEILLKPNENVTPPPPPKKTHLVKRRVQPHLYVIGNKFSRIRVTVFMAHWRSVSMFMTHYARHTTKQPGSLKGRGTNQYRQKKTLIIKLDIFSWARCCSASHPAAQVTSSWFHFHNGDHNLCGRG